MTEKPMFFVLGAPKSGTTWLQLALDRHPQLICKGEGKFHFFRQQLVKATESYNAFMKTRTEQVFGQATFPPVKIQELDAIFRAFVEGRLRGGGGAARVGAKDPDFGLFLPDFAAVYPDASYIHIIRDPRDAAVSMWRHMQRLHPGVDGRPMMEAMSDTARGWASYIANVRAEVEQSGLTYFEVRYEDMVLQPELELAHIFAFLDVDQDAGIIDDCVAATRFSVLSGGREPGQTADGSFYRRGVAGGWREDIDEEAGVRILAVAGRVALDLGYR